MGSHTDPEEFLDNFWKKELNTRGETVTYKFKKDNYYVISGVNPNGYEFYHKVFFYPTYWLEFEITYPHAQHLDYDAWVERIAHDFVPVLPDNGQYDRSQSMSDPAPKETLREFPEYFASSYEAISKLSKRVKNTNVTL